MLYYSRKPQENQAFYSLQAAKAPCGKSYSLQTRLLWYSHVPLPQHLLKRLQRIQFAAASFVTGRYVNSFESLLKLGWLPVRERRDQHLLKMAHKALYSHNWPQTLGLEKVKHTRLLRSNSTVNLVVSHVSNTFRDTTARIFKTLPSGTKSCVDSKSFSKQAFTFVKSRLSQFARS